MNKKQTPPEIEVFYDKAKKFRYHLYTICFEKEVDEVERHAMELDNTILSLQSLKKKYPNMWLSARENIDLMQEVYTKLYTAAPFLKSWATLDMTTIYPFEEEDIGVASFVRLFECFMKNVCIYINKQNPKSQIEKSYVNLVSHIDVIHSVYENIKKELEDLQDETYDELIEKLKTICEICDSFLE